MAKHKRSRSAPSSSDAEPRTRDLAPFTVGGALVDAATLEAFDGWWGFNAIEATTLGLSAVWSCVTLIADAIAGGRWVERKGIEELPPSRIVRRPAAGMTRRRWTWKMTATLCLYTHAPLWLVGGVDSEGVPGSLLPVPPDQLTPQEPYDRLGIMDPTRYKLGDREVSAEEIYIVHRAEFPMLAPRDIALLVLARRVFRQALYADRGATSYWQNGGTPTTVLSTDQDLTTPQSEAIAARWMDRRSMGPGYPAVLGKGAHAEPYGADPTTESGVEARNAINADVARLFRVPRRLVNAPGTDSGTYANAEQDSLDLIRFTLGGYRDPLADCISDLLPGDYLLGRRCDIDLDYLTRPGQLERYQAYTAALGPPPPVPVEPDEVAPGGFMSLNEVRAAEHLAAISGLGAAVSAGVDSGAIPDPSLVDEPLPMLTGGF